LSGISSSEAAHLPIVIESHAFNFFKGLQFLVGMLIEGASGRRVGFTGLIDFPNFAGKTTIS
jgi:hypothetical protein